MAAHAWSHDERSLIVRAARETRRTWPNHEWTTEPHEDRIDLFERLAGSKDRVGRERLLTCGAVLANVEAAIRVLAWLPETELAGSVPEPDRVARVTASRRTRLGAPDFARHRAVFGRALPGQPPAAADLVTHLLDEMPAVARGVGVVGLEPDQEPELPRIGWKLRHHFQHEEFAGLSWTSMLLITGTEQRQDLVRAGWLAQNLVLAATKHRLICSVVTEVFELPAARGALSASLGVGGLPQLLLAVGSPARVTGGEPTRLDGTPSWRRKTG
ncbi:hypothetical protein SAMN05421504_101795 [Amycolatopsis xylanica]|uniref:Nitroreductase family protein n=1 Tax=Amycolatopsis xylanica TaxID=589385 RepID=A0A1H2U6V1_9PSEU|nr:hypothetical protein [Amycolatopsis xylanica]SDW51598.1 hypothetical protein SAMN05421504_101795 [Amycolatopsis xylanica]